MDIVVTGVGTAVPGLAGPRYLLAPVPTTADASDPVLRLTGRGLRYKDRATKLALCAARDALTDARLLDEQGLTVPGESVGVVVSSNLGNVDTVCETVDTIARDTYLGTSPMALLATASNVIASWVAISHGLRGANLTLCNGATSGLDAVHWARLLVAAGRVAAVLVIGVEPANDPVRHLVTADRPTRRLLDGAGALVIESADAALSRQAVALAALGAYTRAATPVDAVSTVRLADRQPVGLWCRSACSADEPPAEGAATHDLAARLGDCSGALGVLQCIAGVAWLVAGGRGAVLAVAGEGRTGRDDAAAALLLRGVPVGAGTASSPGGSPPGHDVLDAHLELM